MANTKVTSAVIADGAITPSKIASGDFYFDTDTLYIDSANNLVGIGQTPSLSDGSMLQITGNDGIQLKRSGQTNGFLIRPNASTDGIRFSQAGTGDRMAIDSSGNVTIQEKLTVDGIQLGDRTDLYNVDSAISKYADNNGVYLNGAGANGWLRLNASGVSNNRTAIDLYGSNAGDSIKFRAGDDDAMWIVDGGSVGIGTSNPTGAKLHVVGAVKATDLIAHDTTGINLQTSNGTKRLIVDNSGNVVINETGTTADFRVETDAVDYMLHVRGSSNNIIIGGNGYDVTSNLEIRKSLDRHLFSMSSGQNQISGSGQAARIAEGVVAIDTTSSGTQLSIPITSQTNLWRPMYIELMFVNGEYNATYGKGGFAKAHFSTLNSIANFGSIDVGGNVSSITTSGMNIVVNFTASYVSGLNNYEGVIMHYKVMSITPDYFQAWNATLN